MAWMQLSLAGDPNKHDPPLGRAQQVYVNWETEDGKNRGQYMTRHEAIVAIKRYVRRGQLPRDYMLDQP